MICEKVINLILIIALLSFSLNVFPTEARVDRSTATTAIESANNQIIICYVVAREAEAIGANITALTELLNEAGLLQSKAELAFSNGDFDNAQYYAVESENKLTTFNSDVDALLLAAKNHQNQDFLVNVVGSICGTAAVLFGSFGLWSFLNRKHQ